MRILLVAHHLPWPIEHGGGEQRTNLLWRALACCAEVEYLLLESPGQFAPDKLRQLRREFHMVARFPWPEGVPDRMAWRWARFLPGRLGLRGVVRRPIEVRESYCPSREASAWLARQVALGRYDAIVGRHLRPALVAGMAEIQGIPRIADVDDIPSVMAGGRIGTDEEVSWRARMLLRCEARAQRRLERPAMARFDHIWFASATDRERFPEIEGCVLPNIPFIPPGGEAIRPAPPAMASREILFVGHLGWEANRQGLDIFLARVYPRVLAAVPDARLRIVGSALREEDRRRWQRLARVEVVGFVDAMRLAYAPAALAIVPVYWGAGTKIKVVEALAFGRTCVATPHALRGYEPCFRHGESLWCGRTDEEFAQGCVRLLTEPALRQRMAEAGRRVVQERFTWEGFQTVVRETLDRLLARRRKGS